MRIKTRWGDVGRISLVVGLLAVIATITTYLILTAVPLPKQGVIDSGVKFVVIEMTMRQWRFDVVSITPSGGANFSSIPANGPFASTFITVRKGDVVILRIKNLDVPHGFAIEEFGINTIIPPGETVEVKIVATHAGRFMFFCTVFCGTGHPNHKGVLIVQG